MTRRTALAGFAAAAAGLTGCTGDGHFSILGYTTKPPYDDDIKTIYVPVFQNKVFQTTPYRGMEAQLTRAVVDAINDRTPYRVTDDPAKADTELLGTVLRLDKVILNRNQMNEVRELQLNLTVEIVWRDNRSGKILTNRRTGSPVVPGRLRQGLADVPAFDPTLEPPPPDLAAPIPVQLTTTGRGVVELGESNTTALKMAVDRMARRVTQAMETPW